jgi:hypothetical protein
MRKIFVAISISVTFCLVSFIKSNSSVNRSVFIAVPEVYYKIYGATSLTNDGTYITIKSNGVPDHVSPYYATSNSLYQTYAGTTSLGYTFVKNPNTIATQTYTFKIPLYPTVAANHAATSLGVIGISLNGVAMYNQYAGPNLPLTNEIASFDKYNGHPQVTGQYHYHLEPLYLTNFTASKTGLLGFLLDGFPVYGPQEITSWEITPTGGSKPVLKTLVSSDLDVYHGHTHATYDFPSGIYHYHFTSDAPYLNGNGYYGTPGTITQ